MSAGFSLIAATTAIAGYIKSYPSRCLHLLAWGMVPYLALGVFQPVGFLLVALSFVVLPTAWWRLFMERRDGRAGIPFRLGRDEGRVILAILPIHLLVTLAVMPIHIGVVLFYSTAPTNMLVLAMVNLTVVPVLVWARLGPSLPLSVAERRYLVTRSWRPTGEIGWKLYAAWLPAIVVLGLLNTVSVLQFQAAPVTLDGLVWLVMLGVGVVMNSIIAIGCATHAYVARFIQNRSVELAETDPD